MNKFILHTIICLSITCVTNAQNSKRTPDDWFMLAEAEGKKDLRQVLYYVNKAIETATDKNYIEAHHKFRLQTLMTLEKWDTAYSCCQTMMRKDETDAEINHACGLVCLKLGKREEGYDLLKRAANSESRFHKPIFFVSFGDCLSERTDYYVEAIRMYSKVIAAPSAPAKDLFKAYQGRGKVFTAQGKTEEALYEFEQANRYATQLSTSDQAQHAYNLGNLLFESHNYAAAAEQFKKAADLNPTLHDALAKRGQCAYELHQWEDAMAHLTNAIDLQGSSDYYYHRSRAYLAHKQGELALKDMNTALRQSNFIPLYRYQRGSIQLKLKAYLLAIEDFAEAIRQQDALVNASVPQTKALSTDALAHVYALSGWAKLQQSKVSKNTTFAIAAKQDFDNALKINTKENLAMNGLALADIYIKPDSNFLPALDRAIAQNPSFAKTLLERGLLLLKIDATRAVKDFSKAIELITKQPDENDIEDLTDAYRYRIQAYEQLSNWDAMLKDLNGFLEKGDSNDLSRRAQAHYRLQWYEKALKDFNICLEKHPNNAMNWYYKSRCLEALQDETGCRIAAEKAFELDKKNTEITAHRTKCIANSQKKRRKSEKPIIIWHSLVQLNYPKDYQVRYGKGNDAYLELQGSVNSQSVLKEFVFEVNNQAQNVTLSPLNDTIYAFGVRVRLGREAYLSLLLKLRNEAGDTILQRDIFIEPLKKCTKSKRGLILVIGNQNYIDYGVLKNPNNDAIAVRDSFVKQGFDAITLLDGKLHEMESKVDSFIERSKDYEIICFYYAGHGTQSEGSNYLIPIDCKIENSLKFRAYNLQKLFNTFNNLPVEEQPCQSIILVDACRSDKSSGLRITERLPPNTIVGFSVDAGQEAADIAAKDAQHGLYTAYLLEHLLKSEAFEEILKQVRGAVAAASNQTQTPVYVSSLEHALRLKN